TRYQTLDVRRGLADSGRAEQIALYTGNDDHIVLDLLAAYRLAGTAGPLTLRMVGGLLGHWAVWTRCAADLVNDVHSIVCAGQAVPTDLLVRANEITDTNAALFDPVHAFAGSIAGIHEILRRQ